MVHRQCLHARYAHYLHKLNSLKEEELSPPVLTNLTHFVLDSESYRLNNNAYSDSTKNLKLRIKRLVE